MVPDLKFLEQAGIVGAYFVPEEKTMALSVMCLEENREAIKTAMERSHPQAKLLVEDKKAADCWTLVFDTEDVLIGTTALAHGALTAIRC